EEADRRVVGIVSAARIDAGVADGDPAGEGIPAGAAALVVHEQLVHRSALHEEVVRRALDALRREGSADVVDRPGWRDGGELRVVDVGRQGGLGDHGVGETVDQTLEPAGRGPGRAPLLPDPVEGHAELAARLRLAGVALRPVRVLLERPDVLALETEKLGALLPARVEHQATAA